MIISYYTFTSVSLYFGTWNLVSVAKYLDIHHSVLVAKSTIVNGRQWLLDPCVVSILSIKTTLFMSPEHCDGQWQRLADIKWLSHSAFVISVVDALEWVLTTVQRNTIDLSIDILPKPPSFPMFFHVYDLKAKSLTTTYEIIFLFQAISPHKMDGLHCQKLTIARIFPIADFHCHPWVKITCISNFFSLQFT